VKLNLAQGILVAVLIACGGEGNQQPLPAAGEPSLPTVDSQGAALVAPADLHPVLVYLKQDRTPDTTLVAYDLEDKRQMLSVPLGRGGSPYTVSAGGRAIAVDTGLAINVYALDGAPPRQLSLANGTNEYFNYLALSQDGKTLAVVRDWSESALSTPPVGQSAQYRPRQTLFFFDVAFNRELKRIESTQPEFAGFDGSFGPLQWLPDGSGVFMWGATQSERPGSYATVLLDGTVTRHDLKGAAYVSHDSSRAAEGIGSLGCLFYSGHEVTIRDLRTGVVLAGVQTDTRALTGVGWSPDDREFLFESRPWSADLTCEGDRWWTAEPQLFVFNADTGALQSAGSQESVYRRWYGGDAVFLDCNGTLVPPGRHPFGNPVSVSCRGAGQSPTGVLQVGAHVVDSGTRFHIIGMIE